MDNSVYKEFNRAVKSLIKDIMVAFPEAEMLKLVSCYFAILKRVNKKKPQAYFMKIIETPHGAHILNKNIDYFMSDQFQSPDWKSLVTFIKTRLQTLDKSNKDKLNDHMLVLMALSKRCQVYKQNKVTSASSSVDSESETEIDQALFDANISLDDEDD